MVPEINKRSLSTCHMWWRQSSYKGEHYRKQSLGLEITDKDKKDYKWFFFPSNILYFQILLQLACIGFKARRK